MIGSGGWIALSLYIAVAIAAATVASRLLKVPYTVALVAAGLIVGIAHGSAGIALAPNLVMYVFLPPLLFAAAWEMDLALLQRWWLPIALLATLGVAIGVAVTYAVLRFAGHVDPSAAVAFGCLVAATDPVAVIALFREQRIDRALSTIVEGESIFNDGVAVVLVRALVVGAASGAASSGSVAHLAPGFDSLLAAEAFVFMVSGGMLVGIAIGLLATSLMRTTGMPVVEAAITVVAAFGAYSAGEILHVSGIVAVIAAGLACSAVRAHPDPKTGATVTVDRFWEALALVANSVLFVLIGLSIDVPSLVAAGPASAWAILAVLAARATIVYGFMEVAAFAGARTSSQWRHVIAIGGLRGALSMALVLGLPEDFHEKSMLVSMVYSVVLFTLVVQGLALRPAMRSLGPSGGDRSAAEASS